MLGSNTLSGVIDYNTNVAQDLLVDLMQQESSRLKGRRAQSEEQVEKLPVLLKKTNHNGRSVELVLGFEVPSILEHQRYEAIAVKESHACALLKQHTIQSHADRFPVPVVKMPRASVSLPDVQSGKTLKAEDSSLYTVVSCKEAKTALKNHLILFKALQTKLKDPEALAKNLQAFHDAGEQSYGQLIKYLIILGEIDRETFVKKLSEVPNGLALLNTMLDSLLRSDLTDKHRPMIESLKASTQQTFEVDGHEGQTNTEATATVSTATISTPASEKRTPIEEKTLEEKLAALDEIILTAYSELPGECGIKIAAARPGDETEFKKLPKPIKKESELDLNSTQAFKSAANPTFTNIPTHRKTAVTHEGQPIYAGNHVDMPLKNYMALQGTKGEQFNRDGSTLAEGNIEQYWKVITSNNINASISLTQEGEEVICDPFPYEGETATYGNCTVENLSTTSLAAGTIQIHQLRVNGSEKPHLRICVNNWVDYDGTCPTQLAAIAVLAQSLADDGTVAVNCRGGIGRTGTFIVASELILAALDEKPLPKIRSLVEKLRTGRGNQALQTATQYSTLKVLREHAHILADAFRPLLGK